MFNPSTQPLSQTSTYLIRMVLFLVISIAAVAALSTPSNRLIEFFGANPILNGSIVFVFVIGVVFAFRYVLVLVPEIRWVNILSAGTGAAIQPPKMLAPLAAMVHRSKGRLVLTQTSLASIMDSIGSRLDEAREILRYLIGLLVFLGLLGTFWGLLITVSAVSELITSLGSQSAQSAVLFSQLISGLSKPLAGMGTAFSSSLFGLAGSLLLGFLDLQLGQAQNRFVMELEDWLSTAARFTLDGVDDGADSSASSSQKPQLALGEVVESLDQLLAKLRGK